MRYVPNVPKLESFVKRDGGSKKTASGLCHYCGSKIAHKNLTMDHLVPLARGGRSKKNNLVPSCKDCNNKKKNMLPLEWEEYLEKQK